MLTPRSSLIGSHKLRSYGDLREFKPTTESNIPIFRNQDAQNTQLQKAHSLDNFPVVDKHSIEKTLEKEADKSDIAAEDSNSAPPSGGQEDSPSGNGSMGDNDNVDSMANLRIESNDSITSNHTDSTAASSNTDNNPKSIDNRPASNSFPKDDISKQPTTDFARPHSHSVGSKGVLLKITFPWNDGSGGVYKVKKFAIDTSVAQAVAELNGHLPEPFKSDKNKLLFNGEPLDPSKLLSSYHFQPNDKLLFTRDPLYEFSLKDDVTKEHLTLEPNMKIFEVVKKLVVWIYGSIPASEDASTRHHPSYKLSKKLGAISAKGCGLRLMEQKNLADYGIRKWDILELVSKGKGKADESIVEIVVQDAPVTAEDKLVEQEDEAKKPEKPEKISSPKLEGKRQLVREDSGVGTPYNVVHKSHVNFDYQWTGKDIVEAFEFKEKLGQGGYGAVYKAQHKETGFTMAVKVLAISGPGRADLQKEIDVLKKCRCPNVLSYYGTILRDNEIWILMDHCGVGSVKDLMKACVETLDEEQISMVTTQVLKGLAYLHAKGIVHMDVKAANILLTEEGSVKLADFGVSQQLQNASEQSDILIGSPLWMAPEIILRNPYNFKADTWSLGITIIEMAEGRPPNRGVKNLEGLAAIPKMPPPTMSNPRAWSPVFLDFLSKCLTKDPNERPSAMDLLSHPFIESASGPSVLSDLMKQSMAVRVARLAQEKKQ